MVLTIVAARRNSPLSGRPSTSSRTVCSRSPCATAPITRVTSVVGHTRSSIRPLTEPSISPQAALERANLTRWRVRPCSPTALPMRSSCCAIVWLAPTISLKSSEMRPMAPGRPVGSRTEKSPARIASRACCSSWRSIWAAPFWAARREGGETGLAAGPAVSTSAVMGRSPCLEFSVIAPARAQASPFSVFDGWAHRAQSPRNGTETQMPFQSCVNGVTIPIPRELCVDGPRLAPRPRSI